jgi:integrase
VAIFSKRRKCDGVLTYYIRFYDQFGGYPCELAGTTRTEAKRLLERRIGEVRAKTYVPRRKRGEAPTTVGDLVERFAEAHPGRRGAVHHDDPTLRYVTRRLGDRPLADLTRADLEAFAADLRRLPGLKNRPISDRTVGKVVSATKRLFKWAVERDLLAASPAVLLKRPRTKPRTRWLSREEWGRLVAAAPPWLKPILTLAAMTGMRLGEIALLRWGDVDLHEAAVVHVPQDTKTGTRLVPLNRTAREVLEAQDRLRREVARRTDRLPEFVFIDAATGEGLATDRERGRIGRATKAAMRAAGIEGATFHSLRHTAASWMVQAGVGLYEVQHVLGHSTPLMTQRYAHLAPGGLRTAVAALDGPDASGEVVTHVNTRPATGPGEVTSSRF